MAIASVSSPPLIESDVAGGRADEARDRVPFHVLRHVEAHQLHAHQPCELARDLGLAHSGGAGEEVRADRALRFAQARTRHLDCGREGVDGGVLPVDHHLEVAIEGSQHILVGGGNGLGRDPRHLGHYPFNFRDADRLAALRGRQQLLGGARFVDDVDRLVGQVAVVDVAVRELDRDAHRLTGVPDLVMLFEA